MALELNLILINIKIYTLRYFLILLLLPSFLSAQTNKVVNPVYSDDYQRLIHADTNTVAIPKSDVHRTLGVKRMFGTDTRWRKIRVRHHELQMRPDYKRELLISGSYSATFALKTTNQLPALQTAFAQGRTVQGALSWQGPATNEVFSYGPALHTLEYDGVPYPYDHNGKLVPTGSGNGHNAAAYMNNIFRTGTQFSQLFNLKAVMVENQVNSREFSINLGQTSEKTFIRYNNNYSKNLDASLGARIKWLHLVGKYTYAQEQFSNANRNGFLNKAYQQSILTPVSFDNGQGYTMGNGQRSYSKLADNPDFLLRDNGNNFNATRQQVSLLMERSAYNRVKYILAQSFDHKTENSHEGYKPGTAAFPEGKPLYRHKEDKLYHLTGDLLAPVSFDNYKWSGSFSANYIFTDVHSGISYQPGYGNYIYQRSGHELAVNYRQVYNRNRWLMDLALGNKATFSNTMTSGRYFQPLTEVSAKYMSNEGWFLLFKSSYGQANTELPISKSLSYVNLLRYATAEAGRYFPVQEVQGFDQLLPIRHKDWSSSINGDYRGMLNLSARVFVNKTEQDLFPVYENQALVLKNIGDYQTKGIDLELRFMDVYKSRKAITMMHTLGFFAYKNKVTRVHGDANFMPLAGFSDVHTALVQGQPLGVIVGNTWEKDAAGNTVIGPDGFPLAAKSPAIIGNPNPDFVMKMTNLVRWKKLTMEVALEWKKGGERWNGTQAVLDYYGRSQTSAEGRTTTGYVFPGVQTNGSPNTVPVDFYNPKLPLENNRWVRYGYIGVAADYIERADWLRVNTLKLSYQQPFKHVIQKLTLSAYINNLMLWTPYSGVDPEQLLFDQPNSTGLDFFNLPATKTYGFNVTLQF
jgi:hypothetical protein